MRCRRTQAFNKKVEKFNPTIFQNILNKKDLSLIIPVIFKIVLNTLPL